jgi:hypothetical protein
MLTNVDIQAASRGCQVGEKHTLPPPRPPTMLQGDRGACSPGGVPVARPQGEDFE